MELGLKEIVSAILDNDTRRVAEMLDGFDLRKDGTIPDFTSVNRALASTMLGAASLAAWREELDEDLAHELIERTAMTINIFQFLHLVVPGAEIENEDFDAIPQNIRTALRRDNYTNRIAHEIEKLDDNAFRSLLAYYIAGEIEESDTRFNLPVIRHIYWDEVIPANLLFAFMASSLRETINEHLGGLHDALGALGGLGLFSAFLDGMHDDDDDEDKSEEDDKKEDHECHCGGCHGGCGGCRGCHSDD